MLKVWGGEGVLTIRENTFKEIIHDLSYTLVIKCTLGIAFHL